MSCDTMMSATSKAADAATEAKTTVDTAVEIKDSVKGIKNTAKTGWLPSSSSPAEADNLRQEGFNILQGMGVSTPN